MLDAQLESKDVSDADTDGESEGLIEGIHDGLLEDNIRRFQKMDTISVISSLRILPSELSRMQIPLCRLVPMLMVRPTLACDLTLLENKFTNGYEEGARVFYVSIADEDGNLLEFSVAEKEAWGPLWNAANEKFTMLLKSNPHLAYLAESKFFVCDGNHRRIAWMNHISRLHPLDIDWHICVDSIVLDTRNRIGVAMQAMHDINK